MVVESKNIEGNDNGTPLLLMSLLLLLAGIVAFYYFSEIRLFYRVLGLFAVLGLSGYITYQTSFGKTIYTYVLESKVELKKVAWPTKQETTQTALGVIVIVVIIGILLWLLDMLLAWAIGTLYGVR
ncbi:MAG: preprotein translocase subunit SecE [Gammaproteobacteria bacterium]|jgi:preprotein translocase subunit SecE|nr:preprotein translocase subunit SecE [Gammaproteobacteria bacterium]MBT5863114.1 preprotein translocase subunit SecE [Gammaproteobacteria bacterium]MBT7322724.1 preprotein translocase subunit SecE [Gammaproteobacteria bacterium]